jgi:RimJ/RimL family protein N-acetyltransferase
MRDVEIVTERLRLRPIRREDLDVVTTLGADERVMAWLGGSLAAEKSEAWLEKHVRQWREHGLGPFAVDRNGVIAGFVGLSRADFDAGIVPGIEVGWRFVFAHWGKGYATEAARAVIGDAFDRLGLAEVVAATTPGNTRSRRVMERLEMVYSPSDTFEHPRVPEGDALRTHVVYRVTRNAWIAGRR